MTFGSPFPSLGEQIYDARLAESRRLKEIEMALRDRWARTESGLTAARYAAQLSALRPMVPPPVRPTRLQPGQLAWCSANVPGFVDLLPAECGPAAGYHDLRNVRIVAVYEGSPLEFGAADISEASVSLKPRIRVRAAMTERADD